MRLLLQYALSLIAGWYSVTIAAELSPAFTLSRVFSQYPQQAMQSGIEGRVVLKFSVDAAGSVRDVRVTESNPPSVFDEAAVAAVLKWRYLPISGDVFSAPFEQETQIRYKLQDTASSSTRKEIRPLFNSYQRATRDLSSLKHAAADGDVVAQIDLGIVYGKGSEVPQDLVESYKWLFLARKNARSKASRFISDAACGEVAMQLTSLKIAEGLRRALEWKPSDPTP